MKALRFALFALCVIAFCGVSAAAQATHPGSAAPNSPAPQSKKTDETDTHFLKQAAVGNMAEIQMGQLAQQKAQASEVKDFGGRMVKDHSAAQDVLTNLAAQLHVAMPANLDPKHKNAKEGLSKLSGEKFDKAYVAMMVTDHQKTVDQFQKEANSANNQSVKEFAAHTLPTLQSHLQAAKDLEQKLKSGEIK